MLRINDVIASTGLSRPTIYREMQAERFPRQVPLTERCVGWREAEIQAWLAARNAVRNAA
jgi:prophage regulatory protein